MLRIFATGDIILHTDCLFTAMEQSQPSPQGNSINNQGFDYLFARSTPFLQQADLVLANLETPITPASPDDPYHFVGSRSMVFNSPPALLPALKRAGFTHLTLANNHSWDQGLGGLLKTIAYLEEAEIPFVGIGRTRTEGEKPLLIERKGFRLALFGYTCLHNYNLNQSDKNHPTVNTLASPEEIERALTAIKKTRPLVDLVVLLVHWGDEYASQPLTQHQQLAATLADAGADLIVGAHPHVLQPMELHRTPDGRTCLILYSLGNFVSNQAFNILPTDRVDDSWVATREGAIVEITLTRSPKPAFRKVSVHPLWTVNNWHEWTASGKIARRPVHSWTSLDWENWRASPHKIKRSIYTSLVDDELDQLKEQIKETPDTMQRASLTSWHTFLLAHKRRIHSLLTPPDLLSSPASSAK